MVELGLLGGTEGGEHSGVGVVEISKIFVTLGIFFLWAILFDRLYILCCTECYPSCDSDGNIKYKLNLSVLIFCMCHDNNKSSARFLSLAFLFNIPAVI